MNIESLKYFVAVVDEKSISKAANKLHLSQSALSQMIQKLEEDLGYELLKRSNRGVLLTSGGEIVIKYANHMIKNLEKMQEELKNNDTNQQKISISATWALAAYSLPCMLYRIKKKFIEYSFELHAKGFDDILSDIKNDLTDFGFVDAIIEDEQIVYHKMGQERVVLIAKSDYVIGETIQLDELTQVELIMCTMNKKTCEHLTDALKPLGKKIGELNVIFNADSLSAVKSSVLNGYGMAFVPYESIKHELYEKSVKLIEIKELNLDYDIYMICKKPKELSPSAKMTREYLIEVGRKSFC